ncbi:MAG: RNA polymerase sigma factor [Bacteroidia bacterium]|nr:RNA polymerase sigma factor [Bacteroidia bacterium]
MTDEKLIQRIQSGQTEACGILYERYKKVLWSFFYNASGEREKSEDLVQLTFEKVLRYSRNFSAKGSVKSWLFSIARNVLKDEWKQKEKHKASSLEQKEVAIQYQAPVAEVWVEKKEKEELLQKALDQLGPEKRELLALVKIHGKKYRELAEIYGLGESALKVKVFRIMQELKSFVAEVQARSDY